MAISSLAKSTFYLVAASFTLLFQELLLIRWLGQQIRVLAYFPNIILIGSFLGLGMGCLRRGKRDLLLLWPFALLALTIAATILGRVVFTEKSPSEHLWHLYYDLGPGARVVQGIYWPILVTFILSAISFIPLGQALANRLEECRRLRSPLWGYLWDLVASAAGTALFVCLAFANTTPLLWFSVLLMGGLLLAHSTRLRLLILLVGSGILFQVSREQPADLYTPYYALRTYQQPDSSVDVSANGSLHQIALPLRNGSPASPERQEIRKGYRIPYRLMAKKPKSVLVLGAGTGNDVAVSIDEGVESIDAVEIDPGILQLGKTQHPDRPYNAPNVHLYNTDARSFLNTTHNTYDLIVFGTLDSMTRLSALSNVRLDNFIYTSECFQAARRHLNPDGGIALYFMVGQPYIGHRLAHTLMATFLETPIVVVKYYTVFNSILMTGPAFHHLRGSERAQQARTILPTLSNSTIPTDDWPFLYLENRSISPFYAKVGASVLILSLVGILLASGQRGRIHRPAMLSVDWQMLLFGMAFLMLEARAVTTMNLLWGATWLTSAIVIESILLTIFIATLVMAWKPISFPFANIGLLVALLGIYAFPVQHLFGVALLPKLGISLVIVGGPIFFASMGFAWLFSHRVDQSTAFGWNLFGAVLGGLLEFLAMVVGFKSLILLAMALYLTAALIYFHEKSPHPAIRN